MDEEFNRKLIRLRLKVFSELIRSYVFRMKIVSKVVIQHFKIMSVKSQPLGIQ